MSEQNFQSLDFIGDIHGYAEPLERLLGELGYTNQAGAYRHSEGRQVVFLGDFIDRGPAIRETLQLVKQMIDAGTALAVMGNHEYNAVCFHTPDGRDDFLRNHATGGGKNVSQHQATLDAFAGREDEWNDWITWFKRLPFALDLGGVRAVHASWHTRHLNFLNHNSLEDPNFLIASATPGRDEFQAVETVLKGIEIPLPTGNFFADKQGLTRSDIRVRWWDSPQGKTYRDLVFPACDSVADIAIDKTEADGWNPYSSTEPPVFFGHYWIPADTVPAPVAPNAACLDYSIAKTGGKLVAYRWDGEQILTAGNFISVPQIDASPKPISLSQHSRQTAMIN